MENPSHSNPPPTKKIDISNKDSFDPLVNGNDSVRAKKERTRIMKKETFDVASSLDYYEFQFCGKKKFRINKELLTFRITQFIWYGGGILPSNFLGIFLKQKGLTVVELSSVFSVIFLFQFVCSFITGIITDKIGNAKPVLMFLMFSTLFVLFSMLVTPNINSISCISQDKYLNDSDLSEYIKDFSSCYVNCSFNYKKQNYSEENYNGNSISANVSSIYNKINYIKTCNFYNASENISPGWSRDDCCKNCINRSKTGCVIIRNGYLITVYIILTLLFYSVYSTTYRFLNFTAISLAEKNYSDFGKEYAVGKSADLFILIIIAFVLNNDKSSGSDINFNPIIWIAVGIMFCACLTLFMTAVPTLPPGKNLMKKAFDVVRDIDTLAFTLVAFVAGNGYAFYLTFHLVFLQTLNASSTLIGLHTVAIVLYGLLLILTSKWWLNKFGPKKIFVLGLLFYGVHFLANSYIHNSWWSLVIDVAVAFSFDIYWVAVVEYCWTVAPMGLAATYMTLTGTVQYGIGRSSGVFFGGMLMNYIGPRMTYRILAGVFFSAAILYSIFVYKRRKSVVSQ